MPKPICIARHVLRDPIILSQPTTDRQYEGLRDSLAIYCLRGRFETDAWETTCRSSENEFKREIRRWIRSLSGNPGVHWHGDSYLYAQEEEKGFCRGTSSYP